METPYSIQLKETTQDGPFNPNEKVSFSSINRSDEEKVNGICEKLVFANGRDKAELENNLRTLGAK